MQRRFGFNHRRMLMFSSIAENIKSGGLGPETRLSGEAKGCGPLVPPLSAEARPLRLQIFERIRAAGGIARVQLARDLSISPGTVTMLTSELLESGYVEEVADKRELEGARGRPSVAIGVRGGTHHVAGIKLSDRQNMAVIIDFAGNLVADVAMARQPGATDLATLAAATEDLLQRVCAKAGLDPRQLSAVGVGVPGFVNSALGVAHWSPILTAREVPLQAALSAHLGLPVYVDNDANLVTMAELWFGAGRSLSDFAVVTIEHGLGMGLVLNHRLYRGSRGVGLELGHTKVQLDGALCRCGQRGCLEAYVADYALVREATTALNWSAQELQSVNSLLGSLYEQAKAGNKAARSIFERAGRYLALGLANVVNLFDPELIILSGERMRFDYLYSNLHLAEMTTQALSADRAEPRIVVHAWGDLLWAHGAAALALSVVTQQCFGLAQVAAAPE
jgi:predicted NBD/HSP70 family sugar kinase